MRRERRGALARAVGESELELPDIPHHPGESLGDRNDRLLVGNNAVRSLVRGVGTRHPVGDQCRLFVHERWPQEGGEHECRCDGFLCVDAAVGTCEGKLHDPQGLGVLRALTCGREHPVEEFVVPEPFETLHARAVHEELQGLFEQTGRRDFLDQVSQPANRLLGLRVEIEIEFCREADRAEHPHRILAVTRLGVTQQSQATCLQIRESADLIVQDVGLRIVVERVDREVASFDVFLERAVFIVGQDQSGVRLLGFGGGTERCHLDDLPTKAHVDDLEPLADRAGVPEEFEDLVGQRVGRDVKVFWRESQQQVADTTTNEVGLVPGFVQAPDHLARV